MTQLLLSFISPGITKTNINLRVSVFKQDNTWTYFLGEFPICSHPKGDRPMFRLTIARLIDAACRQIEVIEAFGISKRCVILTQNQLKRDGSEAFFINNRGRNKGGTVPTPEILDHAQMLEALKIKI